MNHTNTSNVNLVDTVKVSGAIGKSYQVRPNRPVCLIVCSVKQGSVDIFFGTSAEGAVPELHFGQTNKPEPIPIPLMQGEFTVVCSSASVNTLACVIFGGPSENAR